jgi:hypothetical protein
VTTVSDIRVVELPAFDAEGLLDETALTAPASIWAVDLPRQRQVTPVALAALGVLAGIVAMALGTAAVVFAAASSEPTAPRADPAAPAQSQGALSVPAVERRVLALLAKPSTERVAFRGAQGLVLAVGSGGRAAILIRGLERAPGGTPYSAWVVRLGSAPVRAARFFGTERAVFLTGRLGPRASVVVSAERPVAGPADRNRIAAVRG